MYNLVTGLLALICAGFGSVTLFQGRYLMAAVYLVAALLFYKKLESRVL